MNSKRLRTIVLLLILVIFLIGAGIVAYQIQQNQNVDDSSADLAFCGSGRFCLGSAFQGASLCDGNEDPSVEAPLYCCPAGVGTRVVGGREVCANSISLLNECSSCGGSSTTVACAGTCCSCGKCGGSNYTCNQICNQNACNGGLNPNPAPPAVGSTCTPNAWASGYNCGLNGCGSGQSARCNSAGTAWTCVDNPALCASNPPANPGNPPASNNNCVVNGVKSNREACDPRATPTGCNTGFTCNNNCRCIQSTTTPRCGDGICNGTETVASCSADCVIPDTGLSEDQKEWVAMGTSVSLVAIGILILLFSKRKIYISKNE